MILFFVLYIYQDSIAFCDFLSDALDWMPDLIFEHLSKSKIRSIVTLGHFKNKNARSIDIMCL